MCNNFGTQEIFYQFALQKREGSVWEKGLNAHLKYCLYWFLSSISGLIHYSGVMKIFIYTSQQMVAFIVKRGNIIDIKAYFLAYTAEKQSADNISL
jgi:hypothetical protein